MTGEQACALFLRHGCDARGLLPYAAFAARLLGLSEVALGAQLAAAAAARGRPPAAADQQQEGPYRAGRCAAFQGPLTYPHCASRVWAPSRWDGSQAVRSAQAPRAGLELEWVHGYSGRGARAANAFYNVQVCVRAWLDWVGLAGCWV